MTESSNARPPPLDARVAFNNSVNIRISSKRLLQQFASSLASKLYLTEEELVPASPLIESFIKEVCSLTYDIVKDDRTRLGELQERYNTLVEANRRSQLGYMRELVALRDKVRRKEESGLAMGTGDYDVMFYDALQYLDQDAKELIGTVTNERVRMILMTKKSTSDIHGTKHVQTQTDTSLPSAPPALSSAPSSRGASELFIQDIPHNNPINQSDSEEDQSSSISGEAQRPRVATSALLADWKAKNNQQAPIETHRGMQLQQQLAEFQSKLHELDVMKNKLQAERKRRAKLELECKVLKRSLNTRPESRENNTAQSADTDKPGDQESLQECEEELQVFLRLYQDASTRVQKLKHREKQQQELDAAAIVRKFESLANDDPAMNLVDLTATFTEDNRKFFDTKKIIKNKKIPAQPVQDESDFLDLAIGKVTHRKLIVDEKPKRLLLLPVIKTKKEKLPQQLNFLCRDHGGILPPTLACDKCRMSLQPPMGIGKWN